METPDIEKAQAMFDFFITIIASSNEQEIEEMFGLAKTFFEQNDLEDLAHDSEDRVKYPRSVAGWRLLFDDF